MNKRIACVQEPYCSRGCVRVCHNDCYLDCECFCAIHPLEVLDLQALKSLKSNDTINVRNLYTKEYLAQLLKEHYPTLQTPIQHITPTAWKNVRPSYSSCAVYDANGDVTITHGCAPYLNSIENFDKSVLKHFPNTY